ncbi:hypothetical protein P4H67_14355 [Paenibacillus lautus]|uniref:hypothetical protein n=1 Tax=Paenibacillus lautus TaxID=1401 RepID=UPI002DB8DE03|nr:hypothetical protein [Paenibacillus lautus]MEC0307932.1 hypothetical protein [Paenibacillus lautus]
MQYPFVQSLPHRRFQPVQLQPESMLREARQRLQPCFLAARSPAKESSGFPKERALVAARASRVQKWVEALGEVDVLVLGRGRVDLKEGAAHLAIRGSMYHS